MVSQKYRWDFIGLSTDTKPTSETSEKVVNGSTYYCSDTSKLYVYCDGTWYERKPLGGGGGGGTSDFNDLSNRPKYNGSEMTGSTNIPEVKSYTAGTNVSISDQNVISATDTTYSAFTGTDGTAAGVAGLVPAPATTDAGKFLKADGTWGAAGGGGGITELTTADYNWPANNPIGVALWSLDSGWYTAPGLTVWPKSGTTMGFGVGSEALIYVNKAQNPSDNSFITIISNSGEVTVYSTRLSDGYASSYNPTSTVFVENSTGTSSSRVMSQNATSSMVFADPSTKRRVQIGIGANAATIDSISIGYSSAANNGDRGVAIGREASAQGENSIAIGYGASTVTKGVMAIGSNYLTAGYNDSQYRLLTGLYDPQNAHDAATKGYVDAITLTNAGAPTTSTVGTIGQLLEDTTNGKLYICTDATNPYVWEEVGAGGGSGPTVVQTTGTSQTDVMSQNAVTSMVFADPGTERKVQVGASSSASGTQSVAIGYGAQASAIGAIACGNGAWATHSNSLAIGRDSATSYVGEVAIGTSNGNGYNNSSYRLLTGLYDPQSAHDAATKGYVDGIATMGILTTSPTGTTAGVPGRLYTLDTGGGSYEVYLCVHDNDDNTYVWKQVSLI